MASISTPPVVDQDEKPKSRRPKDTKFKQQRLPAWQPILTANTVLPAFFAIGIAFIPLGATLLYVSDNIKENAYDYTHCININASENTNETCAEFLKNISNAGETCTCRVTVTLEEFSGTVYMYYGLTNFYQNHRRYVRSRDDNQLNGQVMDPSQLVDDCNPYKTTSLNGSSLGYAPCGAIANSLFNDTFQVTYKTSKKDVSVGLLSTGIAWVSDKTVKFKNPSDWKLDKYVRPPNWKVNVWNMTDQYRNEDLIVWMRTAALPTFRKFYRRIDHTQSEFSNGLPAGTYEFLIDYNYPVIAFDGTKSIILTTSSWMGGKNPFLGIAYLVVGSLCIILGAAFLIVHLKWGKKVEWWIKKFDEDPLAFSNVEDEQQVEGRAM